MDLLEFGPDTLPISSIPAFPSADTSIMKLHALNPPPKLHFHRSSFLYVHPSTLSSSSSSSSSSSLSALRIAIQGDGNQSKNRSVVVTCKQSKIVRSPVLDRHVTRSNKIRFVQKLKTLLLSKPKHFLPLRVLSKCRSYLSLPPERSILTMIKRYPSIFELFRPAKSRDDLLCVRLTPAATALAQQEAYLRTLVTDSLAAKLQKLLMLSSHRRLLLSKLVHLAPDMGLPANFRSRLCNDHPHRFKTVDTSYGRALELVNWDPLLAVPAPPPPVRGNDLIIDRAPKFRTLKLRKGLNLKRKHRDFLIKMRELPAIDSYMDPEEWPEPLTMEGEKRACQVMREVLSMTVEKRTLIDHLTHFRKEFGLSNRLRAMLVRHPEMFYVSLKGMRDSVFLVEGYDEKGRLMNKDELLGLKERLMELVREGKRMRRERRNGVGFLHDDEEDDEETDSESEEDDEEDGLGELFESGINGDDWKYFSAASDDDGGELLEASVEEFWTVNASENGESGKLESW